MNAYWTPDPADTAKVGGGLTTEVWNKWCDHLAREMALDAASTESAEDLQASYANTNPWEAK